MKPRELGYVLAIDQASNAAGVSLWKDGQLISTTLLVSRSSKDTFAQRIQCQLQQLTDYLNKELPKGVQIEKIVFEGVRSRLVTVVVGAFMCCPRISAGLHNRANFVESVSWKKWAQLRGAKGPFKEIKGVKALIETGWDMEKYPKLS